MSKQPIKIYTRGEIYQYSYSSPDGTKRVRKNSGTKALELEAREYETNWRAAKLGAWRKAETVRRYVNLSLRHLLATSENALSENVTEYCNKKNTSAECFN
ncbi:hypothetical protein H3T83_03085 [Gilliamella sp. M0320]|uniref:hypothetical protein n=1 Tax=Gilliamella sp. M0320 TaxID=2750965 RepID=UPI0018DAF690|nr:hypothetical protein [Gilliamella sp. M0320]MBI0060173.1 hypothetical protein [Gilliamella sp. M0320]